MTNRATPSAPLSQTTQSVRFWTGMAGVALGLVAWMLVIELPDRTARVLTLNHALTEARILADEGFEHQQRLADLRGERRRLETTLDNAVRASVDIGRPSSVLRLIESGATRRALTIDELRSLPWEKEAAHTRLPIALRVRGSFISLHAFMHELETGTPSMRVREATLAGSGAQVEATLLVDLVLFDDTGASREELK